MKWVTLAGPIQTKRVSKALNNLSWEGKCVTELWGTRGVDEHESTVTALFGDERPEATAARAAIFAKYAGTITKENCAAIIADCAAALAELKKTRPVEDKRTTPAENAKRNADFAMVEAERAVEASKKAAKVQARIAELRKGYPWAKQEGSRHARAAYNVKKELSLAFPGIEFSAKSKSFSMGDDVNVGWTLGPTTEEVKKITGKYEQGSFNGMIDMYENDHSADGEAVEIVLGRTKYLMENRRYPDGLLERICEDLCKLQGVQYQGLYTRNLLGAGDYNRDVRDHAYELLGKTSFPAGATYKGVRYATAGEHDGRTWVVIEFEPATAPAEGSR
jgi:hypothetical protein